MSVDQRAAALRWMDRWVDPAIILLAASSIPLVIIETGDPSPDDGRFVVAATWVIWGAFTANFMIRLLLSPARRSELKRLIADLVFIVGQPISSIGEAKARPGLALVPLVVIGYRMLVQGRVLRRTGYKLRQDPIRVVLGVVPFVWLLSAALIYRFERDDGVIGSFGDALWWSVVTLATVGYGDIAPKTAAGRAVAVGVMVAGVAMFSLVTAKLAERLLAHRESAGRRAVLETNHTLILGWSPMVLSVVDELVVANHSRGPTSIVVMADMEPETMHNEISGHVPDLVRSNTTLICRTGNIADPVDLERCRPDRARSIIVVDPTREDAPVVRALLALLHSEHAPRRTSPSSPRSTTRRRPRRWRWPSRVASRWSTRPRSSPAPPRRRAAPRVSPTRTSSCSASGARSCTSAPSTAPLESGTATCCSASPIRA